MKDQVMCITESVLLHSNPGVINMSSYIITSRTTELCLVQTLTGVTNVGVAFISGLVLMLVFKLA